MVAVMVASVHTSIRPGGQAHPGRSPVLPTARGDQAVRSPRPEETPVVQTIVDFLSSHVPIVILAVVLLAVLYMSLYLVGPTQVGLVLKRVGKRLPDNNPIAFLGEAGYQAELLMPGLRFRLWPIFVVSKHPWVQVPADHIGLVVAQVGEPL